MFADTVYPAPDAFASDPDRLARFTREAQTLASLNHSNIAHIHGLEESGQVRAIIMEIVEGEVLSRRIARGALPLDQALPIAKQIAEGTRLCQTGFVATDGFLALLCRANLPLEESLDWWVVPVGGGPVDRPDKSTHPRTSEPPLARRLAAHTLHPSL